VDYRLVIFDSDGTLADTLPWMRGVFNELAEAYCFRKLTPKQPVAPEWTSAPSRRANTGSKRSPQNDPLCCSTPSTNWCRSSPAQDRRPFQLTRTRRHARP
jgi:beta-phosphoglucomutase-like phosphatase (HAD superfamily)